MVSEEQKAFQEKIFSRLSNRMGKAAQGVQASSKALFQQIENLTAELERGAEKGAADAAAVLTEELSRARDEAAGAAELASGLAGSVISILEQEDQVSALEALLDGALRFADGAVLFVLKDDNFGGWRCGGALEGGRAKKAHFPLSAENSLARALRHQEPLCATGDFSEGDRALFGDLGCEEPAGFVVVPLVIRSRAQAVLFGAGFAADRAPGQVELAVFQALGGAAMSAIENIQGRTRRESGKRRPASPPPQKRPKPAPAPSPTPVPTPRIEPVAPVPSPTPAPAPHIEPVAPAPEPQPEPPAPRTTVDSKPRSPWFTPSTRSSSLGSADTSNGVRRNGVRSEFRPPLTEPESAAEERLSPEEQELHDDARRFARLLVSEIKLYNEAKVVTGRQEGDLYQRLRSDIERSRQMYNERVPPSIGAKTNYFMDELVAILAEGNRATLGM